MDYSKIRATWWNCTCYHLEQLNAITSSTDIRCYAHILHDKDKLPNSEELKKPHYHFLVQFYTNQRGAWFKVFATDDMGTVFAQPCYSPKGAFDYLTHNTPTAIKQGKYFYHADELTSTIDSFDCEDKINESAELFADLLDLVDKKITWYDLISRKPKRIHMIGNIKNAYDMLHYERYGYRYFEKQDFRVNKETGEITNYRPPKPTAPKIEMTLITDPKELAKVPF